MKTITSILLLFIGTEALAAGTGEGSVLDLKWPFVNFVVLFSFLGWKIKAPLTNMFDKSSSEVGQLYALAQEKDKEARMKLEIYQKKIASLDSEFNNIEKDREVQQERYLKDYEKKLQLTLERMEQNANSRMDMEERQMIREINQTLLDQIVQKTKDTIDTNQELRHKVTRHLLSRIE